MPDEERDCNTLFTPLQHYRRIWCIPLHSVETQLPSGKLIKSGFTKQRECQNGYRLIEYWEPSPPGHSYLLPATLAFKRTSHLNSSRIYKHAFIFSFLTTFVSSFINFIISVNNYVDSDISYCERQSLVISLIYHNLRKI